MSEGRRTYTLRVKVTLDSSSFRELRKQITEAFEEGAKKADVKKKTRKKREEEEEKKGILAELEKLGKERIERIPIIGGLLGGGGKGGKGAGAAGGAGGGLMAMAGTIFVVAGAIFLVVELLEKLIQLVSWIVQQLRKASIVFDSLFKIMEKIWILAIKPFADLFGLLIRPILLLLLKYLIIPFYRTIMPLIVQIAKTWTEEKIFEAFPFLKKLLTEDLPRMIKIVVERFFPMLILLAALPIVTFLYALESIMKLIIEHGDTFAAIILTLAAFPVAALVVIILNIKLLAEFLNILLTGIKEFVKLFSGENLEKALTFFRNLAGWIIENGEKLWGILSEAGSKFVDWLGSNAGKLYDTVSDFGGKLLDWVTSGGGKVLEGIKWLGGRFSDWISGGGRKLLADILSFARQIGEWLTTQGKKALEAIMNFFIDVYNWLGSTGVYIFNQIVDKVVWLWNRFVEFLNYIIDFLKKYLWFIPGVSELQPFRPIEARPLMATWTPMPHVTIYISGSVYGVDEFEELVRDEVSRIAGRYLYEQNMRGTR